MTWIKKHQVQGNDTNGDAIDLEATASGNLKTVTTNTTPVLANIKQAESYEFDTVNEKVTVLETDVNIVYSVYNVTVNKFIYIMNSEAYAGTIKDCCVFYTSTESGMSNDDELLVLYVQNIENAIVTEVNSYKLGDIVQELRKLNLMFSEAFGTEATDNDVETI